MSLPLHLRAYQEPTRDDLTRLLFNVPPLLWVMPQASPSYDPATDPKLVKDPRHEQAMKEKMESGGVGMMNGTMGMEISAILSVEGKDEVYVSQSCQGLLIVFRMLASVCTETKSSVRVPCTVGQATPSPSLPMLHVPGQTVRPVLPPSLYHPQGRTVRPYYGHRASPEEDDELTVDIAHRDACTRLNSRAGVFALSLATWHGLRIVSRAIPSRTIPSYQDGMIDGHLFLFFGILATDADPPTHLPSPDGGTLFHPPP